MTSCKKNRQEHKKSCPAFFSPIMDDFYVGKCCECIKLHKENKQIPPCYFTEEQIQESKDFSIERFIKLNHICTCRTSFVNKEEMPFLRNSIDAIEQHHERGRNA